MGTNGDGVNDAVERNLISGNNWDGIGIADAGTNANVVAGNYIGVDVSGTVALANAQAGISVWNGATNTKIGTDGSNDAFNANERNIISGNAGSGVNIFDATTSGTTVAGNYIGTNVTGNAVIGNGINGVEIHAGANHTRIGTNSDGVNDAAERNIISANTHDGVSIADSGTNNNTVAGNYIGTNANGNSALGNASVGVRIVSATSNVIGTNGDGVNDAAERNIISGNTFNGIVFYDSDYNVVAGNYIGTDVSGSFGLANGSAGNWSQGIRISGSSKYNRIGTDGNGLADEAERNLVSGNYSDGIMLRDAGTQYNVVAGNYVGTDATGTTAIANGQPGVWSHAVTIQAGASLIIRRLFII